MLGLPVLTSMYRDRFASQLALPNSKLYIKEEKMTTCESQRDIETRLDNRCSVNKARCSAETYEQQCEGANGSKRNATFRNRG